ncbi:molybdopterin-dependent oxidoreductase [Candidatus Woesearchaeota archaeon]|nr:molybdopterin-dependent oxidoreductase [Candidatus Woesearchaeota archaeon]
MKPAGLVVVFVVMMILTGCVKDKAMAEGIFNPAKAAEREYKGTEKDSTTMASPGWSEPISIESREIEEYEGRRLDRMEDILDLSIKGSQYIDTDSYLLSISGLVEKPKNYTYEEALSLQRYSKLITLNCVTGWSATVLWEGIMLKDLFKESIVRPEANTVIFHAYDGYTTSLPLDFIIENDILLAYKINNVTLVPERGFPFQLAAEDKLGYKWIKWVTDIELSSNSSYKGYWESRGYSQEAEISS